MKKYRLKPRFYAITLSACLAITAGSICRIDAACSEKLESGEIIKPAAVYAEEIEEPAEPEPALAPGHRGIYRRGHEHPFL